LDEEAALLLVQHARALSRDFRRELSQYDNPHELKDAIQRQLAKQDLEFGWEDQPAVGRRLTSLSPNPRPRPRRRRTG